MRTQVVVAAALVASALMASGLPAQAAPVSLPGLGLVDEGEGYAFLAWQSPVSIPAGSADYVVQFHTPAGASSWTPAWIDLYTTGFDPSQPYSFTAGLTPDSTTFRLDCDGPDSCTTATAIALAPETSYYVHLTGTTTGPATLDLSVTLSTPSAVPLPASALLFGTGLVGLAAFGQARRRSGRRAVAQPAFG